MSVWAALLPVAMVGTERQDPAAPVMGGPIGALLTSIAENADSAGQRLLNMAAVLATCTQAGVQATPWSGSATIAAPDEVYDAVADASTILLVTWALRDGPQRLKHLVLQALAAQSRRLPFDVLPIALEEGRRSTALREVLQPVLGERGIWLAGQNPAWSFAAGVATQSDDVMLWEEGSLAQRGELLRKQRQRDPAMARARLQKILGELPGRERAELLSVMAHGLSMEDEALLDSLRRDRSREVRQVLLGLLLRLPDCAHVQRAQQRLQNLMKQETILLRKRWLIDAPTVAAEEWKVDGIEPIRPPQDALGERAWWLYQLARQVPLAWWCQHTDLSPSELIKWAIDSDWGAALLRAWRDVLYLQVDVEWCEALLDNWSTKIAPDAINNIYALLPLARRERYWEKQLSDASSLPALLTQIIQICPFGEVLSASFSSAVATVIVKDFKKVYEHTGLRSMLPELCCVLQTKELERICQFSHNLDENTPLSPIWHSVEQVIATRKSLNC